MRAPKMMGQRVTVKNEDGSKEKGFIVDVKPRGNFEVLIAGGSLRFFNVKGVEYACGNERIAYGKVL